MCGAARHRSVQYTLRDQSTKYIHGQCRMLTSHCPSTYLGILRISVHKARCKKAGVGFSATHLNDRTSENRKSRCTSEDIDQRPPIDIN